MDYTITEATLNDVSDIVEITMVSFADAFKKWVAKEICVGPVDGSEGFYIKLGARYDEHEWLVWDNFLNFSTNEKRYF